MGSDKTAVEEIGKQDTAFETEGGPVDFGGASASAETAFGTARGQRET